MAPQYRVRSFAGAAADTKGAWKAALTSLCAPLTASADLSCESLSGSECPTLTSPSTASAESEAISPKTERDSSQDVQNVEDVHGGVELGGASHAGAHAEKHVATAAAVEVETAAFEVGPCVRVGKGPFESEAAPAAPLDLHLSLEAEAEPEALARASKVRKVGAPEIGAPLTAGEALEAALQRRAEGVEGGSMPAPLLIVGGPSGVGKGTVLSELKKHWNFDLSISHTTRQPREGETHGVQYFFVEKDEFDNMVDRKEFAEHAQFGRNNYGTSWGELQRITDEGKKICLLEIEMQGIQQMAQHLGGKLKNFEVVFVFLLPPSMQELEKRLRGRGTDTEESVRLRLETAEKEISWMKDEAKIGQHLVYNDSVDNAVKKITEILSEKYSAFLAEPNP